MINGFGLLGAGAQADEIAEFASPEPIAFRAVDREYLRSDRTDLIDVTDPPAEFTAVPVVGAVGPPGLRRDLILRWPGRQYRTIIAPGTWVAESASVGAGTMIAPSAVVSTSVRLGEHCLVNLGATISHHTVVGDYATISPGVHVAGQCVIGAGVFIGIGAVVTNGVTIADGAIIGAGAVVLDDILDTGVYAGAPARRIGNSEGWLREL